MIAHTNDSVIDPSPTISDTPSRPGPHQVAPLQSSTSAVEEEARRQAVVTALLNEDQPYSEFENGLIATGEASMAAFLGNTKKTKVSSSPQLVFLRTKLNFNQALLTNTPLPLPQITSTSPLATSYTLLVKNETLITGLSTIEINCDPLVVAAFLFDVADPGRFVEATDVEKSVVEVINPHHIVTCHCKKGTDGGVIKLLPRESINRFLFKKVSVDPSTHCPTYIIVCPRFEHIDRPLRDDRVRAMVESVYKIEGLPNGRCCFTFMNKLDLGGNIPKWVMNHYAQTNLKLTIKTQQYFQKLRPLEDLTFKDGEAMAEAFMIKIKNWDDGDLKEKEARVLQVISAHQSLNELSTIHPSFTPLMVAIVRNKFKKAPSISSDLARLSQDEGKRIGEGLALALIANLSFAAAVDEYIYHYPCLQQLEEQYPWTRPMLNVVAKRILASSNLGAKWRAFSGAGLSILDVFSDFYMIVRFINDDERKMAMSILATICFNTALQVTITLTQYRKMSKRRQLKEFLMTVLMVQPGVLAFRVAAGEEKDTDLTYSPVTEMVLSRCAEIVSCYTATTCTSRPEHHLTFNPLPLSFLSFRSPRVPRAYLLASCRYTLMRWPIRSLMLHWLRS
jgi:hypothetical protein